MRSVNAKATLFQSLHWSQIKCILEMYQHEQLRNFIGRQQKMAKNTSSVGEMLDETEWPSFEASARIDP